MLHRFLRWLFITLYKVEVTGTENYHAAGKRVLIIANHLSFLDAILLSLFLPERPLFAVNTHISQKWWMKPARYFARTFPLDPTNPMATKALIKELRKDQRCAIFPEGRITVTGALMKIYEGPGMIADKADAMVLPVRLDGVQYTPFSRLRGRVRLRWFPKITMRILEPIKLDVPADIKGRKRRAVMGRVLLDVMTEMIFDSSDKEKSLFQALLDAMQIHGAKHVVVNDVMRKPMDYRTLIRNSYALGDKIAEKTQYGENVGLLLPNMSGSITAFFAVQAYGRVAAMLNYSTGEKNLLSACKTAKVKNVYTSRKFIEMAKLEDAVKAMKKARIKIHYLEDVQKEITLGDKITAVLSAYIPQWCYHQIHKDQKFDTSKPAVVLFTSGSEGMPKGVALSHQNIQANRYQLSSRIDFGPTDKVFNALPIFHSFGLTAGTILPLLAGIETFFYPSPLHYRIVPELIYDTNATLVFGTDTFLSGYARFAHPYDFYSVRYVFAGAEKLKEETRQIYAEKYGVRIFEGYGATETAPALSMNTPMQSRKGSVGRLLPRIDYKLEDIPGIDDGGRLWVKGPNIMAGYYLADKPGKLQPPKDGWYDTGDIVAFDEDGYTHIKGRAKRFAKIGGEMVSLTAAEQVANDTYPNIPQAVVTIPDKKKGEALVLVTEHKDADAKDLIAHAKEQGISELMVPRKIHVVDALPVLGTGKTDYVAISEMVNG